MSFILDATATCPTCGAQAQLDVPASINADRRPDLRAAILDGSLYTHLCRSCGETLVFEPRLTYLDVGRRQWLLIWPAEECGGWEAAEQAALGIFDSAFGDTAPRAAQAIGAGLQPRLVFGWPAMAEKLLCGDLGLDDVALEALKLAVLARGGLKSFDPALDLRLTGARDDVLLFALIDPSGGPPATRLEVPRAAYVLVKGGGDDWAPLCEQVAGRLYVDMGRVLRAPVPGVA